MGLFVAIIAKAFCYVARRGIFFTRKVNKKMEKDLFGFEKAIQLDHLTKEQIDELLKMFNE
jgi:hypothetical protein